MGLPDQYREVGDQYLTDFGWEGNIMGSFDGAVEEKNIEMILKLNKTQYDENCGCE